MTKSSYLSGAYHGETWYAKGGWQELSILGAALKVGIFSALNERPRTADELAGTLALDAGAVSIVLAALADLGFITENGGVYGLTAEAKERFGDPLSPSYLGWSIRHSHRLMQRWLTLPEALKTGTAVPGDRFSETTEGFIRAMDVYAGISAEEAADHCLARVPGAKTILDIGGATGTISKVMVGRGLKAVLFDTPAAVEVIEEELAADYPDITPIGGDFNVSLPKGPFDMAFLGNIVHIYGPEKNAALFKRVADVLAPGGLIAILDFVRGRSGSASMFGVNMLVNTTDGGTWTGEQYLSWLDGAGFKDPEIIDLKSRDQQLILGSLLK